MAKAEINAGICGFHTTCIATKNEDGTIHLDIQSGCKAVLKLAEQIQDVEPFKEAFWRRSMPTIHQQAPQCLSHPACPVPSGIIKAIEVEAGLALPADVSIKVTKSDE
ncbi:MAG: DUF6951 family protein [Nitrososphaerales archaeon]